MSKVRSKSSLVDLDIVSSTEFEDSLNQCGFGVFSILMSFMGLLMSMAVIFATEAMSYIITIIHGDIKLSLYEKGVVNSITYYGMIIGGLFWAVIADSKGRRPVIILTHALDALFMNLAALCHMINLLDIFKFCSGFCIAGGYTTFLIYLSEVHPQSKRSLMLFVIGLTLTTAALMLPLMAMIILPNYWIIHMYNLYYTNWKMFMNITTIPGMLLALGFIFLPESPKFDHAIGRVHRAHRTFQFIFAINKGKPGSEYPKEAPTDQDSVVTLTVKHQVEQFYETLIQTKYILVALMVFSIQFCISMCQNTLRLWQPTLIASAEMVNCDAHVSICCIIQYTVELSNTVRNDSASVTSDGASHLTWRHYKDNLFVHIFNYVANILAIIFLIVLGPKRLLCVSLCLASCFASSIYFAKYPWCIIMPALFLSSSYIAVISLINVTIYCFPTKVRAIFLCMSVTFGRIGSAIGNSFFPHLMVAGCVPSILWIWISVIFSTIVSFFLPSPDYMP